jgi:hypothetical protein
MFCSVKVAASDFTLFIALGNGDGTFMTPSPILAPGPTPIAVADFNGDRKLDIAGMVQVFLGKGNGTFQPSTAYTLRGGDSAIFSMAVGDLNGDGIPDIAAGESIDVRVFLGRGDGTFRDGGSYNVVN